MIALLLFLLVLAGIGAVFGWRSAAITGAVISLIILVFMGLGA